MRENKESSGAEQRSEILKGSICSGISTEAAE